jgi:hypothetical protein
MAKQCTGTSISSSTKLFESLASKASTTIKNIKRKAVEILSPKKKKKAKHIPEADGDSVSDTETLPYLLQKNHHTTASEAPLTSLMKMILMTSLVSSGIIMEFGAHNVTMT